MLTGRGIEWRDQAVRWWDYWLKNRNTGIMDEPPISIYMRQCTRPTPSCKTFQDFGGQSRRGLLATPANTTLYLQDAHLLSTEVAKPARINSVTFRPSA